MKIIYKKQYSNCQLEMINISLIFHVFREIRYNLSLPGVSSPRSENDWQQLLPSALKHKFRMPCEPFSDVDQISIQNEILNITHEIGMIKYAIVSQRWLCMLSKYNPVTQRPVFYYFIYCFPEISQIKLTFGSDFLLPILWNITYI